MRLVGKQITPEGAGGITLRMEGDDDIWHAYNIIARGDLIRTTTLRKIKEESKTGSVVNLKKKIVVLLRIMEIDYDGDASTLRISGVNVGENSYIQIGQHHTVELVNNVPFTVIKKRWDSLYMDRVNDATDKTQKCDVACIVMEEGLAHLMIVSNTQSILKSKIEQQIPRKRKGASGHDKSLLKFFEKCNLAIQDNIIHQGIKVMLVASPGFVKESFMNYLQENKAPWLNDMQIVLGHSSSGEKYAIRECINSPEVKQQLQGAVFSYDLDIVEEFFKTLAVDPSRAVYSLDDVETAANQGAVETLIISDSLVRNKRPVERSRVVRIISSVRENNGHVKIISSNNVAGERIMQLSGIAALTRFPIYDLKDHDSSDGSEESADDIRAELDLEEAELLETLQ